MTNLTLTQLARQIVDEHNLTLEGDIKGSPLDSGPIQDYCSKRLIHALMNVIMSRKPSTLGELAFQQPWSSERARYYFERIEVPRTVAFSGKGQLRFTVMVLILVDVEAILRDAATADLHASLHPELFGNGR